MLLSLGNSGTKNIEEYTLLLINNSQSILPDNFSSKLFTNPNYPIKKNDSF